MMDKDAMKRADRLNDLRAELAKLDDKDLLNAAIDLNVSIDPTDTRDEREFAIASARIAADEQAAAAAAEAAAKEKEQAAREAFYKTKEGRAQRAKDEAQARDRAVRAVNAGFIRAVPRPALSAGAHAVDPDSAEGRAEYPVPDGGYRVVGSDWVMQFKGGRWVAADLAHARGAPDWREIPDSEGNPVGAKSTAVAD
jgi:hypothetical protein